MAVDADGMPVRAIATAGTTADCKQALALIDGLTPDYLLADRGYDTNEILQWAAEHGIIAVIPPKRNRIEQREYDMYLYKIRHLVENTFLKLKQWRGIAARYAKNTSSFLAAVHIRCFILWAEILV
jgi:transposase